MDRVGADPAHLLFVLGVGKLGSGCGCSVYSNLLVLPFRSSAFTSKGQLPLPSVKQVVV